MGGTISKAETVSIELPQAVAEMLAREAKKSRKSIAAFVGQWISDREAIHAADAAEKRSAGKPRTKAQDLYKECGL